MTARTQPRRRAAPTTNSTIPDTMAVWTTLAPQVPGGEGPVHRPGKEQSVGDRDGSGLRGREETETDAAQDDHDHEQGEQGVDRRAPDFRKGRALPGRPSLPPCLPPDLRHQAHGNEERGCDRGDEQGADGDVADDAVDDHHDGWRNENPHPARGRDDRGGARPAVSVRGQLGHHDAPDGGRVRGSGARHPREEHLGHDDHLPEPSGEVPHERPRQRHQAAADPPDVHDEAGQNEEGYGEHGEGIHPGDDLLRDDDEREIRHHDGENGRDREREADGHGGQHQDAEDAEQEGAHQVVSPAESPRPASRWITISAPDTGTAA